MFKIGPHAFTPTRPGTNDLHIIYVFSGGTLQNPRVVVGPKPSWIGADGNRVDVKWDAPLAPGVPVEITVESKFEFTRPHQFVFTRDGEELGPWTPYEVGPDRERPLEHSDGASPRTPRRRTGELEIINRRGERTNFSPERLMGSLVSANRTADLARTSVDTLTPILHAVGHSPITTTSLRAALAEVLLNPVRPDGDAIRDAITLLQPDGHLDMGPAALVGGEVELMQQAGAFLRKVDDVLAMLAAGGHPSEDLVGLYDEGVSIHGSSIEIALASQQLCSNPLNGRLVVPSALPSLGLLLRLERQHQFRPDALLGALLGFRLEIDWEAVAREILFKVLGVFGLIEFYAPILEILMGGDFADVWGDLLDALKRKAVKTAIIILIKRFLLSAKFKRLLIEKLGREAAEKVFEKIAEKWIPVLGWAMIIGNLVGVLISQAIYYRA